MKYTTALEIYNFPITYYLIEPDENYFRRTFLTNKFHNRLKSQTKQRLPLLDLWSSYPVCLVVADFDELPDHLLAGDNNYHDGWDSFRSYLAWRYGHLGVVTTSPSGKAKIFFKTYLPLDQVMTVEIAHDTLRHLLEEDERELFDRASAAAMRCFINLAMYQDLIAGLDQLPIHAAILDSVPEEVVPNPTPEAPQKPFVWNLLPAGAPELDLLDGILKSSAEWFLARFIGGYAKAGLESIDLGQGFLAEQSRLHLDSPLSAAVIYKALQSFIAKGLLARVNDHYLPGKKSMSYQAQGIFRVALEHVLDRISLNQTKPWKAPTFIADGEWEAVLWRATNHFACRATYLEWVNTLPGLDAPQKKRLRKAERAWAAHVSPRWNTKGFPASIPPPLVDRLSPPV